MSGTSFVQRGQALVDRGQYQDAVKVCRLGLLASPTEVAGRLVLATALCALRRYDEVLAEMRVALDLEPDNPRAHVLKATALLRKGDALQAREVAERARTLDPSNAEAAALVRECNAALGASGKPRRAATAGLADDGVDEFTKHYPAAAGPVQPPAPPDSLAVGDRTGTIELDVEAEGVEVRPSDDALAVGDTSAVELDTGDVELLSDSAVAPVPADDRRRAEPDQTADYRRPAAPPARPTRPETPRAGRRPPPAADLAAGDALDALFPEEPSGVSSVSLDEAPAARAAEPPRDRHAGAAREPAFVPSGTIPSLAHSAPRPVAQPAAAAPQRSRTEDMRVIRAGLGLADAASERKRKKRARNQMRAAARSRAKALHGRSKSIFWLYGLVAVAVIAGAVFAGFRVREARLRRQLHRAVREAARLAEPDTYRAHWLAARAYEAIRETRDDPAVRAAHAREEAVLAADYGEPLARADALLATLGDDRSEDALAARGLVALARGDVAGARAAADAIARAYPNSPWAGYLRGRAALADDDPTAAAAALREALALRPWPAGYVALGIAEAAAGRYAEALAAFDAALAQSPGHPAARIERVRAAVAMGQLDGAAAMETALTELRQDGKTPVERQRIGVAPRQAAWAALALAELALARGDRGAAGKHLEAAAAARPEDDWRFIDALARAYLRAGDVEAARTELAAAAKRWPGRAGVRVRLAEVALAAGNPEEALSALDGVADIDRRPDALAVRGRARLALERIDEAVADLDAALAAQPGLREAQIARAEVDLFRGDAGGAVRRLQPLYDAAPTTDLAVVYASALRRSGERERARAVLDRAIAAGAGAAVYVELARLERDEGRFDAARRAFARAIEADPNGIEARLEAADLAIDVGDVAGAREALDALAAQAATDGRVLVAAARAHMLAGDDDGAAKLLDRAAALATSPKGLLSRERGRLALRRGRPKEAVAALTEAARLRPDDPETRLLAIDAYLAAGDAKGADAALADVLKRFANQPVADLALGRVHLFNDRLRDAMVALANARKSLSEAKAAPRWRAEADLWLGRAHYVGDDLRAARDALLAAVRRYPASADAFLMLGKVEQERGKDKAAAKAYARAVALDPAGRPEAWFLLGETSAALRDRKRAREAFERYLQLAPDGDFAAEAKEALAGLRR